MTLKEFGECLEYNIEHNLKHAVLGLGAPGVGKSQIIRQIGKKYGYKVIDIRLAQMSEVEIGGLIYPNESRTKTVWLSPEILPDEERDGKNTILLLDEITSCTKRVQVAAYQLILDRRIGQYKLPEGTFVVALGNREDDDGVYIQLAGPLADRFEIHYIEPDFNSWKYDFALKYGINPMVIDFLSSKPSALHNQVSGDGNMVFATPRSWERVSDILNIDSDITKPVIQHKIIGNVGNNVGIQFIQFCKQNRKVVSTADFIAGKAAAPSDPETLTLLIESLKDEVKNIDKNLDLYDLPEEEQKRILDVVKSTFRLPKAEFTIAGLAGLMEVNRVAIKTAICENDDENIIRFIKENRAALGLREEDFQRMSKARFLKLWQ